MRHIRPVVWFIAAVAIMSVFLAGFVTVTLTLKQREHFQSEVEQEVRILIPHLVRVQWYRVRGAIVPCKSAAEMQAQILAFDDIWSPLWDSVDQFVASHTETEFRMAECKIRAAVEQISPEHLVFAPNLVSLDCNQ